MLGEHVGEDFERGEDPVETAFIGGDRIEKPLVRLLQMLADYRQQAEIRITGEEGDFPVENTDLIGDRARIRRIEENQLDHRVQPRP